MAITPQALGADMAQKGWGTDNNPYPKDTSAYWDWLKGWENHHRPPQPRRKTIFTYTA